MPIADWPVAKQTNWQSEIDNLQWTRPTRYRVVVLTSLPSCIIIVQSHAEQKSPTIYSLNIRDYLVSGSSRIPAPHNLWLNPVLRHHRSWLYARTRVCHFDLSEAGLSRVVEAIRVHTQKLIAALAVNNYR